MYVCFSGSTEVTSTKDTCPECDANLLSVDLSKVHVSV